MNVRPSILCPVDFSESSAGAVRYAAAVAARVGARVIVMTVQDPLLSEALDLGTGVVWDPADCYQELARFAARAVGHEWQAPFPFEFEVAVGKPAAEILRVCRERSCQLVVISTHGLTGMRKLFFGSTTERVLRETSQPVLITPGLAPGTVRVEDAKRLVHRLLVPVDLSEASLHQVQVACAVAEFLDIPVLLAHVIEPVKNRLAARMHLVGVEADRRALVEDRLNHLAATVPPRLRPEALVAYGDPAEELVKIARDREAGLIVMGLHGSPLLGPRMGSVTYRLLCLSPALVLAVPPGPVASLEAVPAAAARTPAD